MSTDSFFDEQTAQSEMKTTILLKYFEGWANIMIRHLDKDPRNVGCPIAYIDMFSGPGRYKDGTPSTPLLILKRAVDDDILRERLHLSFNDANSEFANTLRNEINLFPDVQSLKYAPAVTNLRIGQDVVAQLRSANLVPTLFFVDPWGYKGLSVDLINAALKSFGCDGIFFFSYDRINRTFGKDIEGERENLRNLFGAERADALSARLKGISAAQSDVEQSAVDQRENEIVGAICEALELSGKYVLPFRFKKDGGRRTSHHIIFASKGFKGYELMRSVMAKQCHDPDGVATFEYNPADRRQPKLFELQRPIDDLKDLILENFAGQTLNLNKIYQPDNPLGFNVGKPFTIENFKNVLVRMEAQNLVTMNPSKRQVRDGKKTLGPNVEISIPQR